VGSDTLNIEQHALILGTLLGDGSLEQRWKNPRLRIDHAAHQRTYVFWKCEVLQNIATRPPHELSELDKRSGKTFARWYFSTKAIPDLGFYRQLFYEGNKKVIRPALVHYFVHPLSLAVWLMDDGYKRNDCNALRMSTDCFMPEEQEVLQQCLKDNFSVSSTLHRKGSAWNIYIPSKEMTTMRELLAPYVIPSMSYKVPPRNDLVSAEIG